jgi:ELWxxDGT repeat protein
MVADVEPGSGSASLSSFTAVGNNTVLFKGAPSLTGAELWVSDGTAAGTKMVSDINPGSAASAPNSLVAFGPVLFFTADNPTTGRVVWLAAPPWVAATTTMVHDIQPGSGPGVRNGASYLYSAAHNLRILLEANDSVTGNELWVTDGTTAGTVQLADINPGAGNSNPLNFTRAGSRVFFTATDGANGIELWAVPLSAFGGAIAEPFGTGCAGTGGLIPSSSGSGAPVVGSAGFTVQVSQARANAAALLLVGTSRVPVSVGSCTLYPSLPAPLILATGANGSGVANFPVPVPNDASLVGGEVFFQTLVVDPNGAFMSLLSFSDGLHAVIGK